jgi:hypothetical protein
VKEDDTGTAFSKHGAKRNSYSILVRKPTGKRAPGKSRHTHRLEDNIKMDSREI